MTSLRSRQLGFSVFAALAAPLALVCAATPWPAVVLGLALAAVHLRLLTDMLRHQGWLPLWLRMPLLLWALLIMAKTAGMSMACFQDHTGFIPLVLLALAAVASRRGAETCGRLSALLWPSIAVLLVGLLLFACSDVTWSHVVSAGGHMEHWMSVAAIALTPSVLLVLPEGTGKPLQWGFWMAAALGLAVSVVSCGVLGSLQSRLQQPLYQMVQGVSVLGVAERLEALLSTALCVSFFLALGLLCAAATELVKPFLQSGETGWASWGVALAAVVLFRPVQLLPAESWFALAVVLGVGVPIATALAPLKKEKKKIEKRY